MNKQIRQNHFKKYDLSTMQGRQYHQKIMVDFGASRVKFGLAQVNFIVKHHYDSYKILASFLDFSFHYRVTILASPKIIVYYTKIYLTHEISRGQNP